MVNSRKNKGSPIKQSIIANAITKAPLIVINLNDLGKFIGIFNENKMIVTSSVLKTFFLNQSFSFRIEIT
jgi:hypothetical protein